MRKNTQVGESPGPPQGGQAGASSRIDENRRLATLLEAEPMPGVARWVAALGVEAHLVGGAVRDGLLGVESHDFDVVVSGRGREVAEGVARETAGKFVPLGGREFASFRVVAGEWELDVWDREGGSLDDDLARRDFTVNTIAVEIRPEVARLVDPFAGAADLAAGRLRATTERSFVEDPLRVLRLARLIVQLEGFAAERATVGLAREAAPGLERVAAERVRDELARTFAGERAPRGLAALIEVGVYPALWVGEAGGVVDQALGRRARAAVAASERLPARAAEVAERAPDAPAVDLPAARWALSFAALPAVRGSRGRADEAASLAERFRDRGFLTRDAAARATHLLVEPAIPRVERTRRRFLHRLGAAWPTAAARLGAAISDGSARRLAAWRRAVADLAALLAADGERILDPPRLLGGEDVQRLLGLPPGRRVGEALARLRQAQVDGRIATRGEAEALLLGREP